ncbi:MAG: heme A synthase [Vicinamibacterales bacterium]
MGRSLSGFQRLALWTTAVTYLLILVGSLVRASGSGLGCPDWPHCFGSWVPPFSAADLPPGYDPAAFNVAQTWTEYVNRLLGVSVGFLIFATTIAAWRRHRHDRRILWPVVAALLLTGYEGWLGGRVVAHELAPWIVTAHLVVALVIVQLLLYATTWALFAGRPHARVPARTALARAGAVLVVVTLVQIGIGTQVRGGVDDALDHEVARPQALATVGLVDTVHRDGALVVFGVTLVVLLLVWAKHGSERPITRVAAVIVALTAAQIAVGLVLVYFSLPPPAQVAHLTLASLVLGASTVLVLQAWWLPEDPEEDEWHG